MPPDRSLAQREEQSALVETLRGCSAVQVHLAIAAAWPAERRAELTAMLALAGGARAASCEPPRSRRLLPERADDWIEPVRPEVTVDRSGERRAVQAVFGEPDSAEWFGCWLRSRAAWAAFTAWCDRYL